MVDRIVAQRHQFFIQLPKQKVRKNANQIVHCTLCQQCTPHHGLHRYGPVRSQHGYVDLGQQLSQELFSSEGLCNNNTRCVWLTLSQIGYRKGISHVE
jgi:hypothetical protein